MLNKRSNAFKARCTRVGTGQRACDIRKRQSARQQRFDRAKPHTGARSIHPKTKPGSLLVVDLSLGDGDFFWIVANNANAANVSNATDLKTGLEPTSRRQIRKRVPTSVFLFRRANLVFQRGATRSDWK